VRYLQNAVTNILNIKQSQIMKVLTVITAVFLPPTSENGDDGCRGNTDESGSAPDVHGNAGVLFTVPFKLVLMLMMRVMDVPMRMDNAIG
jgi:hypothetical protein